MSHDQSTPATKRGCHPQLHGCDIGPSGHEAFGQAAVQLTDDLGLVTRRPFERTVLQHDLDRRTVAPEPGSESHSLGLVHERRRHVDDVGRAFHAESAAHLVCRHTLGQRRGQYPSEPRMWIDLARDPVGDGWSTTTDGLELHFRDNADVDQQLHVLTHCRRMDVERTSEVVGRERRTGRSEQVDQP